MPRTATDFSTQLMHHYQMLFARAMQLEASRAGAEDLVHDTFERALRASDRFKRGTNLRGWLVTIMTNLFSDRRRRSSHEALLPHDGLARLAAPEVRRPNAWETISTQDLQQAVSQLQGDQRSVISLYLKGVSSYRELGDKLGVPPNTIGTRLLRARRRMRSLLETRAGEKRAANG
jgi:RNA polymerase sigma-70 factor, ECF subfamily